jgi:hypothetical protein
MAETFFNQQPSGDFDWSAVQWLTPRIAGAQHCCYRPCSGVLTANGQKIIATHAGRSAEFCDRCIDTFWRR